MPRHPYPQEVTDLVQNAKNCLNCGIRLPLGHRKSPKRGYCTRYCYLKKTPRMAYLEHVHGKPIRDVVRDTLNEQPNKTIAAQLLGVERVNLHEWIKSMGLREVRRWV